RFLLPAPPTAASKKAALQRRTSKGTRRPLDPREVMNSIRLASFLPVLVSFLLAGSAPADTPAPNAKINKKIDNVAFTDAAGTTVSLYDVRDRKAVVVVFLSFECPVSTSYSEPLADLAKTYAERGVSFLAVSAQEEEDAAAVARHAREFKLPFPAYRDE